VKAVALVVVALVAILASCGGGARSVPACGSDAAVNVAAPVDAAADVAAPVVDAAADVAPVVDAAADVAAPDARDCTRQCRTTPGGACCLCVSAGGEGCCENIDLPAGPARGECCGEPCR
jgi:hypothetical protein